jgi:YidC/Oxa1 family membrane protein insertase
MIQLFNLVLFQPLLNLLVFLYNLVPGNDIGLAIILLTVIIKIILFPLSRQSIKSQRALQELQPKIDALKKRYKDEKEKQAKAMMELYKAEKVNPLSSCLPLLIQLPFLIAVFQVFRSGLNSGSLELLYPFVTNPGHLNPVSLGLVDLSQSNIILALLTGAAQFWQAKSLSVKRPPKGMPGAKDEDMMAVMNKQMLYFMPIITVVIGASLPAGLVLYWFVTTALTAFQQQIMFKKKKLEPEVITQSDENSEQ